jgi:lipoprotein-releasing system permease protein
VLGIFISTAAMIIVLSGFNGIEELVKELYNSFDPDIEVSPAQGKTYDIDKVDIDKLQEIDGVALVYPVIEEITMVKHEDQYVFATMKGVGPAFFESQLIANNIIDGVSGPLLDESDIAIMGYGVQAKLQVPVEEIYNNKIVVYGLLRSEKLSKSNQKAFKPLDCYVNGIFSINPEFDNDYFIVPLDFANELLEYESNRTKLEFVLKEGADEWEVKENILAVLGPGFKAKTRYEQNELIFKTNETEKWMVFLILGFIMLISTFNIIASLTMLVLDKKKDIKTLISLGATSTTVRNIFVLEGLLINFLGAFLGALVGFLVCWVQIKFKIIGMENSVVDHWPVIVKWTDVVLIFGTILFIGILSSYLPVQFLIKRHFKSMFERNA